MTRMVRNSDDSGSNNEKASVNFVTGAFEYIFDVSINTKSFGNHSLKSLSRLLGETVRQTRQKA